MAKVKGEKKPKVKKPIYKKWWFWVIIAVLVIGAFGGGGSDTEAPSEDKSATTQESADVEETADETKAKEESSGKTEEDEENGLKPGTDLEIICRKGHPTYYGSVEESHEFWKKDDKKKIIFGDSTDRATDKTILEMDAYRNSDLIRNVSVNFLNFEDNPKLSVEDALPIAASYMPFDVIDEYYEYRGSRKIVPKDGEDGDVHYVVSYGLTDEGSEAYYEKKHEYSGSIDLVLQEMDGSISNFYITFGTPKWMGFLDKNGYQEEEWKIDLKDYK